jgi:hypothetical protein
MNSDFGLDIAAIIRVVEEADVFVVRFGMIDQRLLVDARPDDGGQPFIRVVPPVSSPEERYRFLQVERPGLPLPEQITVFHWPRAVQVMKDVGIWDHIEQRLTSVGGIDAAKAVHDAFRNAERLERADVVSAIRGGEGYETLWQRTSPGS